jgi:hypothetical protein
MSPPQLVDERRIERVTLPGDAVDPADARAAAFMSEQPPQRICEHCRAYLEGAARLRSIRLAKAVDLWRS